MPANTFPKPYTDAVKESDPIMERVPTATMGIGARPSGLPKGSEVKRDSLGLKHVEDQNKK